MKRAVCKSCGAEIVWAFTKRRARMPLDAKTTAPADYSGSPAKVYAILARPGGDPLALNLREVSDGVELWKSGDLAARVSHFATCPNASQHSKLREPGTALAQREAS